MAIISTAQLTALSEALGVPVNGFNCGILRDARQELMLLTTEDINEMLGTDFDVVDIVCDVVQLRITDAGPLLPGEGDLPSVDEQRATRQLAQDEREANMRLFCAEHPDDPDCAGIE